MQHNANFAPARFASYGYDFWTQWMDPMVNLIVAAEYRLALGRWGGSAGWACAAKVGIY